MAIRSILALALLLAGTFLHLAEELLEGEVEPFNRAGAAWAHGLLQSFPRLREAAEAVTHTGDWGGYLLATLVLLRLRGNERRGLLAAVLGAFVLVVSLKALFAIPRPLVEGHPLATGWSFPSGHTVFATCLYGYTGARLLLAGRKSGWFLLVWPLAVAASRVLLDYHWVSDVLGGILVGSSWVLLVLSWMERRVTRPTPFEPLFTAGRDPDYMTEKPPS